METKVVGTGNTSSTSWSILHPFDTQGDK